MKKDEIILLAGYTFACVGIGFCIGSYIEEKANREWQKKYLEGERSCTAIIINDGVVRRVDNTLKTGHIDETYDVSYYDGKSLIIYVYNDLDIKPWDKNNENQKELFADYIISNITIGEDNTIYFDKNVITKEGFIEYRNNILNNNKESVRVRK